MGGVVLLIANLQLQAKELGGRVGMGIGCFSGFGHPSSIITVILVIPMNDSQVS